ncbi:MAG: helix-turn-helix domain-containing protein [Myxococcota bacterium]
MSDDLLSSGEAARILGVGASTIKRWADTGQLQCVKTLGRHRRFLRSEVEALAQQHRQSGSGSSRHSVAPRIPTIRGASDQAAVDAYMELLLGDFNAYDVNQVLLQQRERLGTWHQVADQVGEVLGELGEGWREGRVSIMQEHIATERLSRGLLMCVESIRLPAQRPRALLLSAEHDDHTMGLALCELTLRECGWAAQWSGRRTPIVEARQYVSNGQVSLVCVSASILSADAQDLRRQADELIAACKPFDVKLVLGGRGAWPEPSYGHRLETFEEFHHLLADAF